MQIWKDKNDVLIVNWVFLTVTTESLFQLLNLERPDNTL